MSKTRFVFAVSMFAMLAVNSALAATVTTAAPTSGAGQAISGTVGTVGDVYDWSDKRTGYATAGIASVSYVNNAVDAAGNAAQWAENHAAAAGASAKDASDSAAAAAESARVAQNISGENGVTTSTVVGTDGKVTEVKVSGVQASSGAVGVMKLYTSTGQNTNGTVTQKVISDELAKKVSIDQTTANKNKAVITDASGKITTGTINSGMIENGQVMNDDIAGGAVTVAKTTGIYGYIPTASDGTGSAQIWVE